MVLPINLSGNAFVFGKFNVQYKNCLSCSGGTDRHGESCYYCSISSELTRMVNFSTKIPHCDPHIPALLDLFLLLALIFALQWISLHWELGITIIDFYLNWVKWLYFLILVAGPLIILLGCMIFLSLFPNVIRMSMWTAFFHAQIQFGIFCLQSPFLWLESRWQLMALSLGLIDTIYLWSLTKQLSKMLVIFFFFL